MLIGSVPSGVKKCVRPALAWNESVGHAAREAARARASAASARARAWPSSGFFAAASARSWSTLGRARAASISAGQRAHLELGRRRKPGQRGERPARGERQPLRPLEQSRTCDSAVRACRTSAIVATPALRRPSAAARLVSACRTAAASASASARRPRYWKYVCCTERTRSATAACSARRAATSSLSAESTSALRAPRSRRSQVSDALTLPVVLVVASRPDPPGALAQDRARRVDGRPVEAALRAGLGGGGARVVPRGARRRLVREREVHEVGERAGRGRRLGRLGRRSRAGRRRRCRCGLGCARATSGGGAVRLET